MAGPDIMKGGVGSRPSCCDRILRYRCSGIHLKLRTRLPELWTNSPARRRAPWVVLVIGFGGLLACILGAAVRTIGAFDQERDDQNRTMKSYLERQDALDRIRSQIYLSGTYVRDLLLSPDPSGAAAQNTRLATLESDTSAALKDYARALEPAEAEPFHALQNEIDRILAVLGGTGSGRPSSATARDSFFYDELVPRRTAMLQIADRIALGQRARPHAGGGPIRGVIRHARRTLMLTFGFTFLGGLAAGARDHGLHAAAGKRARARP